MNKNLWITVLFYVVIILACAAAAKKSMPEKEHNAAMGAAVGVVICLVLYFWKGKAYIEKGKSSDSKTTMRR